MNKRPSYKKSDDKLSIITKIRDFQTEPSAEEFISEHFLYQIRISYLPQLDRFEDDYCKLQLHRH